MSDMETIRAGLAEALAGLSGVQVKPYEIANPTLPCLLVLGQDEVEYGTGGFGRGDTIWSVTIRGLVGKRFDIASYQRLDRWLADEGDESVMAAVEADKTLGGRVQSALVMNATGSKVFELKNGSEAIGVDFIVSIQTGP